MPEKQIHMKVYPGDYGVIKEVHIVDVGPDAFSIAITYEGVSAQSISTHAAAPPAAPQAPAPQSRTGNHTSLGVPNCPKCGAAMKRRESARGAFFGCSNYPNCKGLVPIK
jgi:hypothetical protein